MTKNNQLQEFSNFVIFQTDTGKVNIDVFFQDETLWLTQKKMAELFETTPQNITLHLKNIYNEQELDKNATCKEFLQVQKEGLREVKRQSKYYNLKAITAVGYRVNSHRATEFESKGILKEVTGYQRNKLFVFEKYLDIYSQN